MNISKDIARRIALSLLSKKKEKVDKLKSDFSFKIREMYFKTLPKEVQEFSKKHPTFCKTNSVIKIIGAGWNHEIIGIENCVSTSNGYGQTYLELKEDKAAQLKKQFVAFNDAKKEYDNAVSVIQNTIYSLKSFNKIKESFPEAAELLPEETKKELVNINEVRKMLK